jgi:hypothetical protein
MEECTICKKEYQSKHLSYCDHCDRPVCDECEEEHMYIDSIGLDICSFCRPQPKNL